MDVQRHSHKVVVTMTPEEFAVTQETVNLPSWIDLGSSFTCAEAITIGAFLRAWDSEDIALSFLNTHAEEDDPGDEHYDAVCSGDHDNFLDSDCRICGWTWSDSEEVR